MRRVAAAGLFCLVFATAAAAQTSQGIRPPACTARLPDPDVTVQQGQEVRFEAFCTDDGRLDTATWLVGDATVESSRLASTSQNVSWSHRFIASGTYRIRVLVYDDAGNEERVDWLVRVQPTQAPPPPVAGSGDGGSDGSPFGVDPVQAFSAVVGAVVGIGGLALGFVQLRKRRAAAGQEEAAEDEAGGSAAPPAQVAQAVQSNSGTVVGSAGTVIVHAPAPAPSPFPAPSVPPGVPSRRHGLYLALDEARDVLDVPEAGADAINARDLVQEILEDLREGKTPISATRDSTAAAIDRALGSSHARIRAGVGALQRAAEELRR